MKKIVWSPTSRKRIEEIVDYIAAENLDAALTLIEEIQERVQMLKKHPRTGRMTPALQDDTVREIIVRKNYLVVYEIQENQIEILTVRHAKQDFDESEFE